MIKRLKAIASALGTRILIVAGTFFILPPSLHVSSQGGTTSPRAEEHVWQVMDSLPPGSQLRLELDEGAHGDGVRHPWMDLMRKEGVKRALIVVSFDWDGHPQNMKAERVVYYRKFDSDCAQITDKEALNRIAASGLSQQLEDVAFSRTLASGWNSTDGEHPPHRHGKIQVSAFDDERLPLPFSSFYDPNWGPSYIPFESFQDEAAIAQFVRSPQATHKNLDDALMWAAGEVDDSCVINTLVSAGANMNPPKELGTTPLLISVQGGFANNVRALLKAGANPNARNSDGETPLWIAEQGHGRYYPEVVKLLKEHGAHY
jgi:hypothetical protein